MVFDLVIEYGLSFFLVRLLIWEECYYEPLTSPFSQLGIQEEDRVCTLINKMAVDNLVILAGEG